MSLTARNVVIDCGLATLSLWMKKRTAPGRSRSANRACHRASPRRVQLIENYRLAKIVDGFGLCEDDSGGKVPSDVEHARCANCIRSVTRDLASVSIIRREVSSVRKSISIVINYLSQRRIIKYRRKPTAETWPRLKPANFYGVNLVGCSAKKVPAIKSAY